MLIILYITAVSCVNILRENRPEGAPGMETTRKAMRFVAFAHQAQLPRVLCILGPHVLNIDLQIKSKMRQKKNKQDH